VDDLVMKRMAMLRTNFVRSGLIGSIAICSVWMTTSGCELLVDFDRSKIPQADSSVTYEASSGSGMDSTMGGPDVPQSNDQGSPPDVTMDVSMSGRDGGGDASPDAPKADVTSPADASDSGGAVEASGGNDAGSAEAAGGDGAASDAPAAADDSG
jgi:hypothetical protein